MTLIEQIKTDIKQNGPMPFSTFMQKALYAPNLGYYSNFLPKFGESGDFVTAPIITPLFGISIANYLLPILATIKSPCILEFGAGTGHLCIDILRKLEEHGQLPITYYILEVSAVLQQRQHAHIMQAIPHLASRVQWLTEWPKAPFNGVMLANEVLDAMPVTRFGTTSEDILESHIILDKEENLCEVFLSAKNYLLMEHLARDYIPIPYQSEVNLWLDDWLQQCSDLLGQGVLLIIDYGFPQREYYHEDRNQGTLMCHYKHTSHTNPLIHVGEQDITAHVNFTHVAISGQYAGFDVAGYAPQDCFLIGCGILDELKKIKDSSEQLLANRAVLQLISAHQMGELFKVIALSKRLEPHLTEFKFQDRRMRL